jgi:hypothetical protein
MLSTTFLGQVSDALYLYNLGLGSEAPQHIGPRQLPSLDILQDRKISQDEANKLVARDPSHWRIDGDQLIYTKGDGTETPFKIGEELSDYDQVVFKQIVDPLNPISISSVSG